MRYKQDIRTGSAFIVSSVSGESKKYEVMVESVDYSGKEENKGILIRVTDPELLELTGGIVQGMSGSPIIRTKLISRYTCNKSMIRPGVMGYSLRKCFNITGKYGIMKQKVTIFVNGCICIQRVK